MRLIDADAIKYNYFMCPETNDPAKMAVSKDKIDAMPTVQPERKTGHWIPQDFNKHYGMTSTTVYYYPKCSMCGESANYTNFCPNCGADMRGETE